MSKYKTVKEGYSYNREGGDDDRWQWIGERTDMLHAIEFLLGIIPYSELPEEMICILERIRKNKIED